MFLYCGTRLVGIIGYHLTASLPPQPTSPKIGFSYRTGKFRQGLGIPRMAAQIDYMIPQPQSR
jgi:hypothetical protein